MGPNSIYTFLTGLPRNVKGFMVLVADHLIIVFAWYIAISLRLNNFWHTIWLQSSLLLLIWLLVSGIIFAKIFRLSDVKLGSFENHDLRRTMLWVASITVFATIANGVIDLGAPRTVPVIFGSITFLLVLTMRLLAIAALNFAREGFNKPTPVAIYGAGEQGMQLAAALRSARGYRPVMFIDDNRTLRRTIMAGLRVHSPHRIEEFVQSGRIEKVFLATSSMASEARMKLAKQLTDLGSEVLELPSFVEMIKSGGIVKSLRPVQPEELLGRDGVDLGELDVIKAYQGSNILVSGAGGSIGSELCQQIIEISPKSIVLFEMSEFALYSIEAKLAPIAQKAGVKLFPVLGSVCDAKLLDTVFKKHDVDVVLHAAAYKHVPLIESNEIEGARNNVLGTKTIAEAAQKHGVRRFIQVSTDKAVRPTNIMGATKRLAELVIQNVESRESNDNRCIFSIVRFGNVLGSSGSVIPLFKQQIASGGPLTVTDREVTRFFMTISEASRLVLLAGAYAEGGEVFVLDMGKPVKIFDLAKQIIKLSGLSVKDDENPNGDIAIEFTGLRPGEKLYEELLIDENTLPTPHEKLMRAKERKLTFKEYDAAMKSLSDAVSEKSDGDVRKVIKKWVHGYQEPS